MGSNFADFDNDGWLDFYLGTGEPSLATLVPNRMFKNVSGARFADITGTSRTGHLQKGHAVACGDWDRDGDVDLFIEMGGSQRRQVHNVCFRTRARETTGSRSSSPAERPTAAIGPASRSCDGRPRPSPVVSSGSSSGQLLEQTIGLGCRGGDAGNHLAHQPHHAGLRRSRRTRPILITNLTRITPLDWKPSSADDSRRSDQLPATFFSGFAWSALWRALLAPWPSVHHAAFAFLASIAVSMIVAEDRHTAGAFAGRRSGDHRGRVFASA